MIEESAVEFENETDEEMVTEFRRFLDEVTPDEFAAEPEEETD